MSYLTLWILVVSEFLRVTFGILLGLSSKNTVLPLWLMEDRDKYSGSSPKTKRLQGAL